jgi:hypothetical protein
MRQHSDLITDCLSTAMMNRVPTMNLGKLCVIYLDELLIYNQTADEQLEHIRLVLRELQRHILKIKLCKHYFGRTSVNFLGHVVETRQRDSKIVYVQVAALE